jgi:hypothetical protein
MLTRRTNQLCTVIAFKVVHTQKIWWTKQVKVLLIRDQFDKDLVD